MEKITFYLSNLLTTIGSSLILPYILIFIILTLCGIGHPIPEDIVLVIAGLVIYNGKASMAVMMLVSLAGVLAGDYLVFMIGRKWGIKFLNHKIFMNAFSEKRMSKVHRHFDKHGDKTIFFGRFFYGLRAATFFIAGTHTMSGWKFLLFDSLGAIISTPLIVYLAYHFGGELETALKWIKLTEHTMFAIVLFIILIFVLRHYRKKRTSQ